MVDGISLSRVRCPMSIQILNHLFMYKISFVRSANAADYWLLCMEYNSFARLLARAICLTKMNLFCDCVIFI